MADTNESKIKVPNEEVWSRLQPKWEVCPTGDWYGLIITLPAAPNAFHRFMQGLVFGIKWRRKRDALAPTGAAPNKPKSAVWPSGQVNKPHLKRGGEN